MSKSSGWVAVDLDGCLAHYDGWKGVEHIGEPIIMVRDYVKNLIDNGVEVRIFTARVQEGEKAILPIQKWCYKHLGKSLDVTDRKDMDMVCIIDDRALNPMTNLKWIQDWDTNHWDIVHVPLPPAEILIATIKRHWDDPNAPPLSFKK